MSKSVTSHTIKDLLATKHSEDVFVPECKDGPSWGRSVGIMDAWAMKRSWAKPCFYGYEIKVSRSDFVKDDKWRRYLDSCNQFYFVCPRGLIQPDEVSTEAGLIWVASTGTRLFTKKKAPHREIEFPWALFNYIIMCRASIKDDYKRQSDSEYWTDWLKTKEENRKLGYQVSQAIREQACKIAEENENLKEENEKLAKVRGIVEKLGLQRMYYISEEQVQSAADDFLHGIPKDFIYKVTDLKQSLEHIEKMVTTFQKEDKVDG